MKKIVQTPEAQRRSQLVQAHVTATLEAANRGEISIPTATKARVIVQQAQAFLNQRMHGIRTVDKHVKKQIEATKGVIMESFKAEGVPLPQKIIDSWVPGQVKLRLHWGKEIEYTLSREQLLAMPAVDDETRAAVSATVASLNP